ncbi:PD-(D/E)XK nuclease family protein [Natronorubrum aibiense]|uniref:PD-(D/E)XK endonuclease-like domain-containing protein n=1 Tax=Natronorubrum aibiense TaxID=348826 RepID=A0A5P9P081_9EURY|nr:hypothetical protein [Natronorubrum aibiense]QFU81558.1 hypothetical protein GCU68_02790 [Natronorubrum aibiense]
MTEHARDDETDATKLTVDGLETYLHCPRQYEFAHDHGLAGSDDDTTIDDRVALLRAAICDGLRDGETDHGVLVDAMQDRLEALWADHDEPFHSLAQRRHERRVLEATLEAYVDRVGVDHASGIETLTAETDRRALVGPEIELSSTVSVPGPDGSDETRVSIESTVDYVYADGSAVVGVRFVPTLRSLGLLRYRSDWEGAVAEQFTDHFDPETDVFEPAFVGALFETAVIVGGLRARCEQLGLEDRTCRYIQVPLADRSRTAVNWASETVETSLEEVDLTDAYIDHHTFGMTHEHRNRTVDDRLATVASQLAAGEFEPTDRWDEIASDVCPNCEYSVCCQEYIAQEVRFDG